MNFLVLFFCYLLYQQFSCEKPGILIFLRHLGKFFTEKKVYLRHCTNYPASLLISILILVLYQNESCAFGKREVPSVASAHHYKTTIGGNIQKAVPFVFFPTLHQIRSRERFQVSGRHYITQLYN